MHLSGVSRTALLTLRARADEHLREDRVFADPRAREWMDQLPWPAELDHWYEPQVQSFLAFRADDIDRLLTRHLASRPGAVVVELGAGLSTRAERVPGAQRYWHLDLPEVIAARRALGDTRPSIPRSVLDRSWFDELGPVPAERLFFIAEGLLYYLPRAEVDALFLDLRRRFPGATVCFDVLGELDWEPFLARSTAAGAPGQWCLTPPFERVLVDLGLEPVPGVDLVALMEEHIERNYGRFGAGFQLAVRLGARVPALRAKRSGTVIGRLAPLPAQSSA